MTQLAIGRAFDGLDVAPSKASWSGNTLTIEGPIVIPTATSNRFDVLKACRDRFNALVGNVDEKYVPVTFSEDSSWDGFYQPLSASMNFDEHHPSSAMGRWSCVLERAANGGYSQVEVVGQHYVRTNPHSISNTTWNAAVTTGPICALPDVASDVWTGTASGTNTTRTVQYNGSSAGMIIPSVGALDLPLETATTYTISPSGHYVGACEIRTTYGSATGQLVGGRFCPVPSADVLQISNGLIRCTAENGGVAVEVYDGTQWEDLAGGVAFRIRTDIGGSISTWTWGGGQVVRNSPEECTVRFIGIESAIRTYGRVWLDLTVKRGSRMICGVARCDVGSGKWDLTPSTSIAATALTGGLRATSADAANNRAVWCVGAATAVTNNTTTGQIQKNTAGELTFPFGVGVELNGSSATGINTAQQVAYEYFDARAERMSVVRR